MTQDTKPAITTHDPGKGPLEWRETTNSSEPKYCGVHPQNRVCRFHCPDEGKYPECPAPQPAREPIKCDFFNRGGSHLCAMCPGESQRLHDAAIREQARQDFAAREYRMIHEAYYEGMDEGAKQEQERALLEASIKIEEKKSQIESNLMGKCNIPERTRGEIIGLLDALCEIDSLRTSTPTKQEQEQ